MSAFNKGMMRKNVTDKLKTLCLHAIANEAFQKALPFDKGSVSEEDGLTLSRFMYTAIESLGGAALLDNAIKNCKDPNRLILLKNIDSICTEAANKCADRAIKECDERNKQQIIDKDDTKGLKNERIIQAIQLNQSEYDNFINKTKSLDIDKIADCINEEVITVIKKEKEAYQKEEDLKNQIAMELEKDTKTQATVESILDIKLGKKYAKNYVSVFSSIQEVVMESLVSHGFEDGAIYKDILSLAFNTALNKPVESLEINLESVGNFLVQNNEGVNMKSLSETGYINTLAVYTALETLHTMNLINYTVKDAMNFIDERGKTSDIIQSSMECTTKSILNQLATVKQNVNSATSKSSLVSQLQQIENFSNVISGVTESTSVFKNDIAKIKNEVATLESLINSKIDGTAEPATESIIDNTDRKTLEDVAQMSKINNIMGKNPRVEKITFEASAFESNVNVIGMNGNDVVSRSFITLKQDYSNIGLEAYLGELKKESKLNDCKVPVFVNAKRGKGEVEI